MNYVKMTLRQLEAASIVLANKKAEIRSEQRKINVEIAKKTAKASKK